MTILSVDLAERYSAAVRMDRDCQVMGSFDAREGTAQFVRDLTEWMLMPSVEWVVIEDIPNGIRWQGHTRRACHVQGAILNEAHKHETLPKLLWIQPPTWQRHFKVFREDKKVAIERAKEFGYVPPVVMPPPDRGSGEARALARKMISDYCDAFLIGKWALEQPSLPNQYCATYEFS